MQWFGAEQNQAITWISGDPGQWRIYASLGFIVLITSQYGEYIYINIYIYISIKCREKGAVRAHEGYIDRHSWKWAIPTRQVGSGRGMGWTYFVKSQVTFQSSQFD